ncbi:hypothetical protein Agub_g1084, partial [Astrephomene gubernaculifera]
MADGGGDLVAEFMEITGADDGVAIQMLEAANFSLEEALGLFYAAEGDLVGGRAGGSAARGGGSAAGGASAAGGPMHTADDEDAVRAPLPTKVERLYGDEFDPRAMAARYHGLSGRSQPQPTHIDVFRDFRAETEAAQSASTAAAAAGDAAGGNGGGGVQGLSGLFKLPADLVFPGTVELAKSRAAAEGRWLLVNVQSPTEFASHRLNRDTWSHEALKEVLKGTFVFYQTYENSPDGRALVQAYRLASLSPPGCPACPAILVVDPITGAQLWHRAGFMDPEKLMEELVPFMDHGPLDAGASSLALNNMKRKAAPAPSAAAAAGGPTGRGSKPLSEDEELALAIAMSMERGGGAGSAGAGEAMEVGSEGGGAGAGDELDDLDEAAIWEQIRQAEQRQQAQQAEEQAQTQAASSKKSPEEVAAEARARVPPEPAEGDPDSLRVALRLPDGSRLTRRFRRSEPVRALMDLALGAVAAAAAGRSLVISHAMPGGGVLSDP